MITLIISLTALALSIIAWWLAFRQNRRLTRQLHFQQEYSNALFHDLKHSEAEKKMFAALCSVVPDSFGDYFAIVETDNSVSVCKKFNGKYCLIKEFVDPDQDFNRREAEELREKLKEK